MLPYLLDSIISLTLFISLSLSGFPILTASHHRAFISSTWSVTKNFNDCLVGTVKEKCKDLMGRLNYFYSDLNRLSSLSKNNYSQWNCKRYYNTYL